MNNNTDKVSNESSHDLNMLSDLGKEKANQSYMPCPSPLLTDTPPQADPGASSSPRSQGRIPVAKEVPKK